VDVGGTFTDAVLVASDIACKSAGSVTDTGAGSVTDTGAGSVTDTGAGSVTDTGAGNVAGKRKRAVYTAKVPSTPADQSQGVMQAIHAVLGRAGAEPHAVERLAHGMTVATNALLEGKGARTALVATEGFTDIVELGRQARAELYRLCAAGPRPMAPPQLRFAAPERMTPEGVLRALEPAQAQELVARIGAIEPPVEAVAVVLLHAYAHPQHEQTLGELIAERLPEVHVSLSHELVGTFREYERAASTEVDAALSPLLAGYLRGLSQKTSAADLPEPQIMQSSGGLIDCARAAGHAALTVLSGPAGGVGGARLLAQAADARNVVCFDMGGTSCDVCTIADGEVAETTERTVAGRPLALPALDIHTVGAGGGSIAWRDAGGALRVGPASAGAEPGPACYGRGGERPTVTDANVILGRMPHDAPLAGGIELDREAAEQTVAKLAAELGLDTMACAEGIVRVAEAEMAGALRRMTVERGVDPRGFALMPFGGAGPLHAAALAEELGMSRVLCPRASGVLCALGLAAAAPRRDAARTVLLAGKALSAERIRSERDELIDRARAELGVTVFGERGRLVAGVRASGRGLAADENAQVGVRVRYELRYRGQSFELGVEEAWLSSEETSPNGEAITDPQAPRAYEAMVNPQTLRESFAKAHEERYGYRDEAGEVELVTIRVSAWGEAPAVSLVAASSDTPKREKRRVRVEGVEREAEYLRGELPPGTRVVGPAVCALPEATLWVPPGWRGEVDAQGTVELLAATEATSADTVGLWATTEEAAAGTEGQDQ
jgi:N-methylhydantoinase A